MNEIFLQAAAEAIKVQQSPLFIILSAASSLMLMLIVFFLHRFINSYDSQLVEMRTMIMQHETGLTTKFEKLKEEIRAEIVGMNNEKFLYRIEQTKMLTNVQTTQGMIIDILSEIKEKTDSAVKAAEAAAARIEKATEKK